MTGYTITKRYLAYIKNPPYICSMNTFEIGDYVNIISFDLGGEVVSIQKLPEALLEFFGIEYTDMITYKIKIGEGEYITTSEDNLEKLTPQRSTDEQQY